MDKDTQFGSRTLGEWEELNALFDEGNQDEELNSTSDEGEENFVPQTQEGYNQVENTEQQQPPANTYSMYGKEVGLNTHNEKLGLGETLKDVGAAVGEEFTKVFLPKSLELNYHERTNAAHNVRMLYRYGISTALLAWATGGLGNLAVGAASASKIGLVANTAKALNAANKTKLLGKGALGLKALKLGQMATEGATAGAIADYNLYRPEEGEGHIADLLPQNEITKYFQSDENDTEAEARFKEALNGLVLGIGFNLTVFHPAKAILSKLFKSTKKLTKADTEELIQESLNEIKVDSIDLEKLANKQDLFDYVQQVRKEALESGQDFETLLREKGIQGEYLEEARQINKLLDNGQEPFFYENGKITAKISKWEDFADLTDDEIATQLKQFDETQIDNIVQQQEKQLGRKLTEEEKSVIRKEITNSNAINFQDKSVEDTWKQRGLLGVKDDLIKTDKNGKKTVNKEAVTNILNHYKDKFNIGNKIKITFVNGLPDGAEGMTTAAKNIGKTSKTLANKIDKQKLKIQEIEDKIKKLEGNSEEITDPLDVLQEELRIAKNELKDLQNFLPDIDIKIDKNAKNPYAALRSELEHANDIAHNKVPKDDKQHFSRYNGANEGEVAPSFVKHKADKKQTILKNETDKMTELSVKDKLKDYDFKYISAYEQRQAEGYIPDVDDGYFPDEEYLDTISMKDKKGNVLAFANLETEPDGTVVPYIVNKGVKKGVARKIFAYLMNEFPYLDIKWEAINQESVKSYKHFCEEFPELAKKLKFEDKTKIDTNNSSLYNSEKGVVNGKETKLSEIKSEQRGNKGTSETNSSTGNERPEFSEMESGSQGKESTATSSATTPEQLKLDFTNQTTDDIVRGIVNGERQATTFNVDALIDKIVFEDKEISGFKWKNIAEDAESYVNDFLLQSNSELRQAVLNNDVNSVEHIVRRQLAANKAISILFDQFQNLGLNATKEQKRQIFDFAKQLSAYVKNIGSASGRMLNAQKLNIRARETFGKMALSDLEKQGLSNLADLLDKGIKEFYNLKFTRNQEEVAKALNAIIHKFDKNTLDVYHSFIEDKETAKKLNQFMADCVMKGVSSKEEIEKSLHNLIEEMCYDRALKVAALAPDKESWIKTALNYVWKNTGAYYVHNLLSGFGSTARNVFSGLINTAYYPAKKILAGYLGGGRELTEEGLLTYKNLLQNVGEAWSLARQVFLKGEGKFSTFLDDGIKDLSPEEIAKLAKENTHSFNEFSGEISFENFAKQMQNLHSLMTRVMGASDEFMSQLNYRAVGRAKSLIKAKSDFIVGKPTAQELAETAQKHFDNMFDELTGLPKDFETYNEVREMLYMNNLSGKSFNFKSGEMENYKEAYANGTSWALSAGQTINRGANSCPVLKVLFPFIKSGTNILQMNLDHNLIYLAASADKRKLLLDLNSKEGALLRSQAAFGALSFGMAAMLAMQGSITGSAPSDPNEKKALFATGWKPYAIRVGDKFISYQGIEPIHTQLGFAADFVRLCSEVEDPYKDKNLMDFFHTGSAMIVNNFLDKAAFRTGLRQMQLLTSPDDTSVDSIKRTVAQIGQGFLPDIAMVRNISTAGETESFVPQTNYDRLFNKYFNKGLGDYRRDVFGNKQSMFNMIISQATPDNSGEPEYAELERLAEYGFYPTQVNEGIDDTNLKTKEFINPETNKSVLDAVKERLSTLEIDGKTLQQAVRELVTSDDYACKAEGLAHDGIRFSPKDDTKINAIRKLFVKYNTRARQEILNENIDSNYVDRNGRTLKDAIEEVEMIKVQELENNGYTTEDWLMNF